MDTLCVSQQKHPDPTQTYHTNIHTIDFPYTVYSPQNDRVFSLKKKKPHHLVPSDTLPEISGKLPLLSLSPTNYRSVCVCAKTPQFPLVFSGHSTFPCSLYIEKRCLGKDVQRMVCSDFRRQLFFSSCLVVRASSENRKTHRNGPHG